MYWFLRLGILSSFCVVFTASCVASQAELSPSIQTIKEKRTHLESLCKDYKLGNDRDAISAQINELDSDIKQLILKLFAEGKSLADVIASSSEELSWSKFPRNVNLNGQIDRKNDRTESIRVFYRHYTTTKGLNIYLLSHSFWFGGPFKRAEPSIYTIIEGSKEPKLVPVWANPHSLTIEIPTFLGFVDHFASFPKIILLHGPSGTGEFISIYQYALENATNSWRGTPLLDENEVSKVIDFSYDESTSILQYIVAEQTSDSKIIENKKHSFAISNDKTNMKEHPPASSTR